ncbi:MAG: hypothetical protein DYH12_10910 [Sorangiineae bacterium PRO1]|nr:hypothetical protein [Sorangiineae bacterium PRO1]
MTLAHADRSELTAAESRSRSSWSETEVRAFMLSGISRDFSSSPLTLRARFEPRNASRVVAKANTC